MENTIPRIIVLLFVFALISVSYSKNSSDSIKVRIFVVNLSAEQHYREQAKKLDQAIRDSIMTNKGVEIGVATTFKSLLRAKGMRLDVESIITDSVMVRAVLDSLDSDLALFYTLVFFEETFESKQLLVTRLDSLSVWRHASGSRHKNFTKFSFPDTVGEKINSLLSTIREIKWNQLSAEEGTEPPWAWIAAGGAVTIGAVIAAIVVLQGPDDPTVLPRPPAITPGHSGN